MIDEHVDSIMEVVADETLGISLADYAEVLTQVRERIDGLIDAAMEDMEGDK